MSSEFTATKNTHGRRGINWCLNGSLYVGINVQKSPAQLSFDYTELKITAYMRKCLPNTEIFQYSRMNAAVDRPTAAESGSISYLGSMYEGWNFNSGNYLFTTDTK